MFKVQEWAEVHPLHDVEHMAKAAIATKLGMSRNTVSRLLFLAEPPRYEREPSGSMLDPFKDEIAAMLDEDPRAPATVEDEAGTSSNPTGNYDAKTSFTYNAGGQLSTITDLGRRV